MNRRSENIVAYGNYFMDENSFDKQKDCGTVVA